MGIWNGLVRVATGLQIAFDIALDANVIAIIILAIAALIVIIVLLVTHWKAVTKVVQEVCKHVTDFVGRIATEVGLFFNKLGITIEKGSSDFARRPGYWIGYLIGFILGKLYLLDQYFVTCFL